MKLALLLGGAISWIGVAAVAIGMAEWDEPVWGFFPIVLAVIVAWAVGEYITDCYISEGGPR
jgi:membrane protein implicated in regulation of membrane protease activity